MATLYYRDIYVEAFSMAAVVYFEFLIGKFAVLLAGHEYIFKLAVFILVLASWSPRIFILFLKHFAYKALPTHILT